MSIEVHQPEIEALIQQPSVVDERLTEGLCDSMSAAEGIRRGLEDVAHGRTRPAKEALDEFRQRHRIPR